MYSRMKKHPFENGYMKKVHIFSWLLLIGLGSKSQSRSPVSLITAIEKSSVPGIKKSKVEEQGNISVSKLPQSVRNIEVYIEVIGSYTPTVHYVWIEGRAYTVTMELMSTPIIWKTAGIGNNEQVDTIVKASQNKVWRLIPKKEQVVNRPKKPALKRNQLSLVYTVKGRRLSSSPIEIRKLAEDILQ